jgi:hypothetical protein
MTMNTFRPSHRQPTRQVLLIIGVLLTPIALAEYDLSWFTVDGGGDMWTTGSTFELSGTVGQPDAGVKMIGGTFELNGGFWPLPGTPSLHVGDLNCNGTVGFDDINPFVQYLSNFAAWQASYPGCNPLNGDINGDGVYGQGSFGDINPFVALLSGGM